MTPKPFLKQLLVGALAIELSAGLRLFGGVEGQVNNLAQLVAGNNVNTNGLGAVNVGANINGQNAAANAANIVGADDVDQVADAIDTADDQNENDAQVVAGECHDS